MVYQKSRKKQAIDKFELVSNKIAALMESGKLVWRKPWHSSPSMNIISGHKYSGINPLLCGVDLMLNDWEHPFFLSFKQAQEKGWKIKKGSKSTWIMWGGSTSKEVENEETGETEKQYYSCKKWFNVFNVECIDDSEAQEKMADYLQKHSVGGSNHDDPIATAEEFVKSQDANIKHGGDRAFYHPATDTIQMPKFDNFTSSIAYYATVSHELSHWTGHKNRLARDLSGSFGTQSYAREELIAELSSAFVCNHLQIDYQLENHASYLQSWIKIIKNDSKAFFTAAKHAQKAAKFLLGED